MAAVGSIKLIHGLVVKKVHVSARSLDDFVDVVRRTFPALRGDCLNHNVFVSSTGCRVQSLADLSDAMQGGCQPSIYIQGSPKVPTAILRELVSDTRSLCGIDDLRVVPPCPRALLLPTAAESRDQDLVEGFRIAGPRAEQHFTQGDFAKQFETLLALGGCQYRFVIPAGCAARYARMAVEHGATLVCRDRDVMDMMSVAKCAVAGSTAAVVAGMAAGCATGSLLSQESTWRGTMIGVVAAAVGGLAGSWTYQRVKGQSKMLFVIEAYDDMVHLSPVSIRHEQVDNED
jgi:hypothetical protein